MPSPPTRSSCRGGRPGSRTGALRQTADGWVADSPMGEVIVEFAPANEYGVLDHVVRMPSGEAVYNPLRVIPAGENQPRCEVVFTVRRARGHDRRGVRKRRGDGGRRPGPAATAGGGLAARGGDAQAEPYGGGRGGCGQHGGRGARGDDARPRPARRRRRRSAASLYIGQGTPAISTSSRTVIVSR